MDYATSPVPVTPGPQPTAAVVRNAGPTTVTGFDGLLQSATTDSASADVLNGQPASLTPDSSGATVVQSKGSDGNAAASTVTIVVADADTGDSANKLTTSPQVLQTDAHAIAMAVELGANVQSVVANDPTGSNAATVPALLKQSLTIDAGPKAGAPTHLATSAASSTENHSVPVTSNPLTSVIEPGKANPVAATTVVVNGLPVGSAPIGGSSAAVADDTTVELLPSRGLDLSGPVSVAATPVAAKSTDSSVVQTAAPSANDAFLVAGRVGSAPLLQGAMLTLDATSGDQQALSRVVPAATNTALPADVRAAAANVELMSTHAAGASASATALTTARELMARQRSGAAANDESVSQVSRGGTEARILEVNGARANGGVTPVGNAVTSMHIESKAEMAAKHTNAVTLAAAQDEKLLRVSNPATNQQQVASRIGGVDVSQIGQVDFAPARLDTPAVAQPVSRISILEPGWTSQLGTDLRALVARGTSTTQVQVTPAELGPLDIEVSVNRQEVSVRILAMHGQTREMLEAALPRLRDSLGQSYASVEVSVGSGTGNSTSGGQQHSGQAGTLGMSSNQDGLPDAGVNRDTATREGEDGEEGVDDVSKNDQQDGLIDDSPAVVKTAPARGLVDAYA